MKSLVSDETWYLVECSLSYSQPITKEVVGWNHTVILKLRGYEKLSKVFDPGGFEIGDGELSYVTILALHSTMNRGIYEGGRLITCLNVEMYHQMSSVYVAELFQEDYANGDGWYLMKTKFLSLLSFTSSFALELSNIVAYNRLLNEYFEVRKRYEALKLVDEMREDELVVTKLGLPQRLVEMLQKRGITKLFPIQRVVQALGGRDIIARAETGTWETLTFGVPILKGFDEAQQDRNSLRQGHLPKVLVHAPTRKLAKQVEKEFKEIAPYLSTACIYGGVSYVTQETALSRGVDIVVGTPGRIIDLIDNNLLKLGKVPYLVLDEADQMLGVGFEEDVEAIMGKLPSQRHSILFSATMPSWVKKLARKFMNNPQTIDLVGDQEEKLAEAIKLYALPITSTSKRSILGELVTVCGRGGKAIVFTQTKRDADEVSIVLTKSMMTIQFQSVLESVLQDDVATMTRRHMIERHTVLGTVVRVKTDS